MIPPFEGGPDNKADLKTRLLEYADIAAERERVIEKCDLCGEPMPPGEEMFSYHGYSGDCPKPPLPKVAADDLVSRLRGSPINTAVGKLDHEAANTIKQLTAAYKDLAREYDEVCARRDELLAERDNLRKEVEALRTAILRKIKK